MSKDGKIAALTALALVLLLIAGLALAKGPGGGSPKNNCEDTDGGINPEISGLVSGFFRNSQYSNSDYCINPDAVMEYYCSSNLKYSTQISCGVDHYTGNYCLNNNVYRDFIDYYCASSACSSTRTPQLVTSCTHSCIDGTCVIPSDTCAETDGGFNIFMQGTTSGWLSGEAYSNSDTCLSSILLREHYCLSAAQAAFTDMPCPFNSSSTCVNGACT